MEEIKNMCRACAMEIETESDFKTMNEFKDKTPINILQYLFPDLQLQLTMANEYKLCIECSGKLLDCKYFKQMIVETEKQLKRFLCEIKISLTADNCGQKKTCPQIQKVLDEINKIQCNDTPPKKYANNKYLLSNQMKLESTIKIDEESIYNCSPVEGKTCHEMLIVENKITDSNKTIMSPYEKLQITFVTEKTLFAECKVLVVLAPKVKFTFGCNECREIFPKKGLLAEHLLFHDKVRRGASDLYECKTCNKTFDNFTDFKVHETNCIKALHAQRFQCRYCDDWLRSTVSFKLHEPKCFNSRLKQQKIPYLCSICGKTYDFYSTCCSHERQHKYFHEKNSCNFCTKEFRTNFELKAHIAARHISCTVCDDVLSSKEKSERHMYQVHGVKLHECEVCKKRFGRKELMMIHMRDVHSDSRFVCEICGKIYKTKALMQGHIENMHKSGQKLLKCLHCDRKFRSHTQRKCHTVRVHEPEKLLQCEYCPKRMPVQCLLKKHINLVHKKIRKVFTCTICATSFNQSVNLKRHMKIHLAENVPQKCKYCDDTLADRILYRAHLRQFHKDKLTPCSMCPILIIGRNNLWSHMRQKHKVIRNSRQQKPSEKAPFPCSTCDRTFMLKTNRARHEQTVHIRKTTYSCNLCEKFFYTALALKYHRVVHTGERPYPCKVCNKRFTHPTSAYKHKKMFHPNL